jgi:hypothetical protein
MASPVDMQIRALLSVVVEQQSMDRAMSAVQQRASNVKITVGADTASATSNLGKLSGGAAATQAALRGLQAQATTTTATLSGTVSVGGKAADTIANLAQQAGLAARRFIAMAAAAGSIALVVRGFRDGVAAAVAFDLAMNKVQQAGGETADKVAEIRGAITSLSTTLGVSSKELADVALKFKSAGLSVKETQDALKAVALTDVSSQFGSIAETGEAVIAVMKQFHVESGRLTEAFGGINAVAKAFAIESRDVVEGVKKAGGAFASVGGDINEFVGLLTSVRGTTRESAEEISTGLRTIFTRLQRGDTVKALEDLGVHLRYTREEAVALGNTKLDNQFVGAYEAVKRLSEGLEGLKTTDPRYAAVIEQLGGYRQVSRVIPLLKQFEDAERAKNVALAGGISLTADAETRQAALANKLDVLKEKFLATFRAIAETKGFQAMADAFLKLATSLSQVLDFAKPLVPVLAALAAVRIGTAAGTIVQNVRSSFFAPVGGSLAPPVRRAGGGMIPGSGDGDTVPALLTPGEFVITKAATRRIGPDNLRALNDGGRARVERFATGGLVRGYAGGGDVPGLTDDQWALVMKHATLAEKGARKYESRGVSDSANLAQDALLAAARDFDPGKGEFKSLFSRILQGKVKDALKSAEAVAAREGGLDAAGSDPNTNNQFLKAKIIRGAVDAGHEPNPLDELVHREEMSQVRRAFGGDLSIGSAQDKNNRGGVRFKDIKATAQGLGIRGGSATTEELTNSVAERIHARIIANRASDSFVGPPRPPGGVVAAPGGPEPDPRESRFAQLNVLRRDGTRSLPLSSLNDLGLSKGATDALTSEARLVANEAGKLADAMAGATRIVVQMRGGLAQVIGLKDVGGRSQLTTPNPSGSLANPAGPYAGLVPGITAHFGGFGAALPPPIPDDHDVRAALSRQQQEQARFTQEAGTRDLQRQALAASDVQRGRRLSPDVLAYQDRTLAEARARQELDAQRQEVFRKRTERAARDAVETPEQTIGRERKRLLEERAAAENAGPTLRERVVGFPGAVRSRVGGFLSSAGSAYSAANDRFGAFAGRYGVGQSFGTAALIAGPLIADRLDREGKSPATRGLGGALQGATLGGLAGASVGGPIGAAVGAVVGGLAGLVASLNEAAADIAKVKINNALTAFADRLQAVNNAIAGGGLSSVSPSALADLSGQLRAERSAQTDLNRREATHTFGGFDPAEFGSLQQKADRQNLASQLPGIQQFLNAQVADAVRRNPAGKPTDLVKQVLADNGGANGELAGLVANVRQLSPGEIRKELEKYALGQQRSKAAEDAGRTAKDDQTLAANTFGRLLLAVESASGSLTGLQARAQALGDAFDGAVTAIHVNGAEDAGKFGRQDRAGVTAFDAVAAVGGEQGAALRGGAVAIDDVKRVLPGVLASVAGRDRLGDEDAATAVDRGIRDALKIKGVASPEIQRALNTVGSGIKTQTEKGEKPFNDSVRLDASKEVDRLLAPLEEPFKDLGGKIAAQIQENANKFIDGLAILTKRTQQAGEAEDRVSELALGRLRTETQIRGFREGRPGQALDALTLAELSEPARARAARLAQGGGLGAGQAEDVVAISRRLAEVTGQIPGAIDRQQEVAHRTGGQGPEFQAAANALATLQSQASSLTNALRNLTDVSTRAAAAQQKVEQFQRERDSRLSLGERYLTASPEQKQELDRGALLANAAYKQKSFDGFISEDIASALGFLHSAGSSTLKGFDGSPRADDVIKKLVGNTAGGAFGLTGAQAKEESEAQKELVRLSKSSEDAQKAFAESLKRSADGYFDNLKAQQQQFFERLVAELKGVSLADAVNRAGRTGVEATEAAATSGSAGRLKGLGLSGPAQVKANADALTAFVEASSGILDRQKRAAGAAGVVLGKAPAAILTEGGRDKFLADKFPELDETARSRVNASVRQKREDYYDRVGDNPTFDVVEQHLTQAVRAELLNEREGPYRAAEDRQADALGRLRGVKGLNVDGPGGLVSVARDEKSRSQFQSDIAAVKDLTAPFSALKDKSDGLAAEFGRLQQSAQQLQAAVDAGQKGQLQAVARAVGVPHLAAGGSVFQPRGTDTVPAMLTPGEFVVNRQSAAANKAILEHINSANGPLYKADGGMVGFFKKVGRLGLAFGQTARDAGEAVANEVRPDDGKVAAATAEEIRQRAMAERARLRLPQYRAAGGKVDYDEFFRQFAKGSGQTTGHVPSTLPGVRPVDDRLEEPDFPNRGGLLRPVPYEEQLRRARRAAQRAVVTAGPDLRSNAQRYRDELNDTGEPRSYARQEASYPVDTSRPGDPIVEGRNYDRAGRQSDINAQLFAEARARYLAQPPKAAKAAKASPVADATGVGPDLDREAAINPYGASALFRAHQQGEGRGSALLFAGQVADFNRRSFYANFGHNPIAERLAELRQTYNLEAGRQERRRARPMLFAGGGPVPGTGAGDTVPAMLTPGEFVLRQSAAQRLGAANLQHLNGGGPVYRADGGGVSSSPAEGGFAQAAGGLSTALNQWSQSATSFGQQLAQAFTAFAGPAHALTEAMQAFPKTLSMTAQHNVVVTFNGAEMLAKLTPELRDMAVDAAKAEIRKSFKEALPDSGAHLS